MILKKLLMNFVTTEINYLEEVKALFDTSVLVAAIVDGHPKHEKALPWLSKAKAQEIEFIVSSHTLAELYAVLSALPVKPRISPSVS